MYPIGKVLIITGVALIIVGLAFLGKLGPLGKLPGDILISRNNITFYFPIATSIIISVIITIFFFFFRK